MNELSTNQKEEIIKFIKKNKCVTIFEILKEFKSCNYESIANFMEDEVNKQGLSNIMIINRRVTGLAYQYFVK